jgi:hypothetical protein
VSNTLDLLELAIKDEGSAAKVARKLNYSPATICLIRKGKYDANSALFAQQLRKEYAHLISGQVKCPALKYEIHTQVCKRYREAVKTNEIIVSDSFTLVKQMCPYCPLGGI